MSKKPAPKPAVEIARTASPSKLTLQTELRAGDGGKCSANNPSGCTKQS